MIDRIRNRFKSDKAQGLVEYGLIMALVSIVAIATLTSLGGKVNNIFESITGSMGESSPQIRSSKFDIVRGKLSESDGGDYIIGSEIDVKWEDYLLDITHTGDTGDMIQVLTVDGVPPGSGDKFIATGMTLNLISEGEIVDKLSVVVRGDLDGDGVMSPNDSVLLNSFIRGVDVWPSKMYMVAGDLNQNGELDSDDYMFHSQILAHIVDFDLINFKGTTALPKGEAMPVEMYSYNDDKDIIYGLEFQEIMSVYGANLPDILYFPNENEGVPLRSIGEDDIFGSRNLQSIGLKSIVIPDTVTSISDSAFEKNSLTDVTLPSSLISIGASAFANNKLTTVVLPNSLVTVGNNAFVQNLLSGHLIIPDSVTTIGTRAFKNRVLDTVLTSVEMSSTTSYTEHDGVWTEKDSSTSSFNYGTAVQIRD